MWNISNLFKAIFKVSVLDQNCRKINKYTQDSHVLTDVCINDNTKWFFTHKYFSFCLYVHTISAYIKKGSQMHFWRTNTQMSLVLNTHNRNPRGHPLCFLLPSFLKCLGFNANILSAKPEKVTRFVAP